MKHLSPNLPYIVVSIANRNVPHPVLRDSSYCKGVLRLAFDDVEASRSDYLGERQPMTLAQAHAIRQFVEANIEEAELIVVHCEAGVSRSPAVAAALWRWLEGTRGPFFERFRPNPYVYRTLMEALA